MSEFRLHNGIRKIRLDWIFSRKEFLILVSSSWTQCFRIRPCLQQSFPCSWQNLNCMCMLHNLSGFYFQCFHFPCFWQEGRGRKRERETPSSLHYYFLFFQVGCSAMLFHTGFCSATRNWREFYKNLTVLSSLDAYR